MAVPFKIKSPPCCGCMSGPALACNFGIDVLVPSAMTVPSPPLATGVSTSAAFDVSPPPHAAVASSEARQRAVASGLTRGRRAHAVGDDMGGFDRISNIPCLSTVVPAACRRLKTLLMEASSPEGGSAASPAEGAAPRPWDKSEKSLIGCDAPVGLTLVAERSGEVQTAQRLRLVAGCRAISAQRLQASRAQRTVTHSCRFNPT